MPWPRPALALPAAAYSISVTSSHLPLLFQLPPWLGDCAVDFLVVTPERIAGGRQLTDWTLVR